MIPQKNPMIMTPQIIAEKISKDPQIRAKLARESHLWFFKIYFKEHAKYEFADFHRDFFKITEDFDTTLSVITCFRNSGKSTIFTTSYPIWAIIGKPQRKFVVIIALTQRQAKQSMENIKTELESNVMLKKELGPFESQETEWGAYSIIIPKYNAKIMVLSMEQSMRGIRYGSNRPDLAILDDVEELSTIKNPEIRDKTWDMITGSILPAGAENLKVIVIGSKLHEDGVIMRFRKEIESGARKNSNFMEVSIVSADGRIAWPARFKTMEDVNKEKMAKTGGNETAWRREYMNEIVPEGDAIILETDIKRYKDLPPLDSDNEFRFVAMSVDPATSEKKTADCTAITIMVVYGYEERLKIRMYPLITNERLEGPDVVAKIKEKYNYFEDRFGVKMKIFVETVGAFVYISQTLNKEHFKVESITVKEDKRARLEAIQGYVKDGTVLFPESKIPELERQLTGFGATKNDDLCDSFTMGVRAIVDMDHKKRDIGMAVMCDDGSLHIVGDETSPPKKYYYRDGAHTEPPAEFYKRMQSYVDEGWN